MISDMTSDLTTDLTPEGTIKGKQEETTKGTPNGRVKDTKIKKQRAHQNEHKGHTITGRGWQSLSSFLPWELAVIAAMSGVERGLVTSPCYTLDCSVNSYLFFMAFKVDHLAHIYIISYLEINAYWFPP